VPPGNKEVVWQLRGGKSEPGVGLKCIGTTVVTGPLIPSIKGTQECNESSEGTRVLQRRGEMPANRRQEKKNHQVFKSPNEASMNRGGPQKRRLRWASWWLTIGGGKYTPLDGEKESKRIGKRGGVLNKTRGASLDKLNITGVKKKKRLPGGKELEMSEEKAVGSSRGGGSNSAKRMS